MALLPSLKYQALRPKLPSYPQELATLGDHIRARWLDLGLHQKEAAKRIGITHKTLVNWENNHSATLYKY